jgi:hypothetical protein
MDYALHISEGGRPRIEKQQRKAKKRQHDGARMGSNDIEDMFVKMCQPKGPVPLRLDV